MKEQNIVERGIERIIKSFEDMEGNPEFESFGEADFRKMANTLIDSLHTYAREIKQEISDWAHINSHKVEEGKFVWLNELLTILKDQEK